MDVNKLYAYVEDLGEWIGNLETAVGQILGYLPQRNKMKTRLAVLLITLSFNALAGDNIIQQQLKITAKPDANPAAEPAILDAGTA